MSEQREQSEAAASQSPAKGRGKDEADAAPPAPAAPNGGRLAQALAAQRAGLRALDWRTVLLFGAISGLLMSLAFLSPTLTIIAGIVPVGAGMLLGRRVKANYGLHGFMTGVVGGVAGAIALASQIFLTPLGTAMQTNLGAQATTMSLVGVWAQLAGFTALSLIAFCTFGAGMSGRTEERNRNVRQQLDERGGQLQRPGTVRAADDIRGLSLPQLGTYVKNLFTKQGFQFKDYRFIDKDKHLDLWMEHEGEPWHLRLSVADKISPGTIESLTQEMKREGCRKGVVVASTEFMPSAVKAAKGRPIVLIDGPTLYDIAEK